MRLLFIKSYMDTFFFKYDNNIFLIDVLKSQCLKILFLLKISVFVLILDDIS